MIKSRIFWYWNTDTNLYLRTYVSTFRILCRSVFLQNNHWTSFSRHSSYNKVRWSNTSRQIAIDCVDVDPLTSNIRQVLKLKILVIQLSRFMTHRHGGPVMQLPISHIGEQSSSRPYCNVTPMLLITCQRGTIGDGSTSTVPPWIRNNTVSCNAEKMNSMYACSPFRLDMLGLYS